MDLSARCSLPIWSCSNDSGALDLTKDRRLPPLPRVNPLPPGPFKPFTPNIHTSPLRSQMSSAKSSCLQSNRILPPPSSPCSAESSSHESLSSRKSNLWINKLSQPEVLSVVAPRDIRRKSPLQQCGQKRKNSLVRDPNSYREKHRVAEANRRKSLRQLYRELDTRVHDSFLIQAGWDPTRDLPRSKEYISQAAIYLIDFMRAVIFKVVHQNSDAQAQLPEKLQPQFRCMELQRLVSALQQQSQSTEHQFHAVLQEKRTLEEHNRALELQLTSHDDDVVIQAANLSFETPRAKPTALSRSPPSPTALSQHWQSRTPGRFPACASSVTTSSPVP